MPDLEIPDGFAAAPAPGSVQVPDGFTPQPSYTGKILPFSTDAQGNPHLDMTAGMPGALMNAFRLPGDVASGAQPVLGANGQVDPNLLRRSINFAGMTTPIEGGSAIPSAMDLKNAATAGYDAFRNSGLEFSGPAVGDLAQTIKQSLQSDGFIAEHAPKTFAALDQMVASAVPPEPGATSLATASNMQAARRSLTKVSGDNTDIEAARQAKSALDSFLSSPPDSAILAAPSGGASAAANLFSSANGNFAAAQRSNALTGALDRANTGFLDQAEARAAASHSGLNLDNNIRQRVASFLQNPQNVAGLSNDEISALNGVVQGGPVINTLRRVGNLMGGGQGMHGGLFGTLGAITGGYLGGGEGAALGGAIPLAVGALAKSAENGLARRALTPVDEMIRSRSPLYNSTQTALPPSLNPAGYGIRGLLPSFLQPGQQQQIPGVPMGQPIPAGLLANWS